MSASQGLIKETAISRLEGMNATEQGFSASVSVNRAFELATALQTTLDIGQLIDLFSRETQKHFAHEGLVYRFAEQDIEYRAGKRGRHSCSYRLVIEEDHLGELEFSRGRKFSEHDTVVMEVLLSRLLYPLRNALLYRAAVNASLRDPLTGVNNRSSLDASMRRETELARRHETPFALIVLDIDHFKSINDRFGHLTGDLVLKEVAQCAAGCVRSSDMLFRYGGEEFVMLLSNTDQDGALLLAERIRNTIERLCCTHEETTLSVTASLGVACLKAGDNHCSLFERADGALYKAKRSGRNRVVFEA